MFRHFLPKHHPPFVRCCSCYGVSASTASYGIHLHKGVYCRARHAHCTNLSLEGWGLDTPADRFDSATWDKLYKPCLACGTCTFVCPTCQCYDIKDYNTGNGVQRYRCWDSCMYSDFTMMAHGNNRTSQLQRFRQRFMHKLSYFPKNNDGAYSCVGCGRCVDKCPASLNIVKVIKAFGKEESAK